MRSASFFMWMGVGLVPRENEPPLGDKGVIAAAVLRRETTKSHVPCGAVGGNGQKTPQGIAIIFSQKNSCPRFFVLDATSYHPLRARFPE